MKRSLSLKMSRRVFHCLCIISIPFLFDSFIFKLKICHKWVNWKSCIKHQRWSWWFGSIFILWILFYIWWSFLTGLSLYSLLFCHWVPENYALFLLEMDWFWISFVIRKYYCLFICRTKSLILQSKFSNLNHS